MPQKQYKDLTDQEVFRITSILLHTVKEEKEIAEEFNTTVRVVRRIARVLRIDSEKREKAIALRKRYLELFEEGSRIRYEAESQFRESIAQGLRKFWAELEEEQEEEELLDSLEDDGLLATDEPDASE